MKAVKMTGSTLAPYWFTVKKLNWFQNRPSSGLHYHHWICGGGVKALPPFIVTQRVLLWLLYHQWGYWRLSKWGQRLSLWYVAFNTSFWRHSIPPWMTKHGNCLEILLPRLYGMLKGWFIMHCFECLHCFECSPADVIKHNGRKIGRFKPRRFCEVNVHISAWIFVWIQFLTLFKLYMKDMCWCFVYNEIEPFENRHGWRRLKLVMTSAPRLSQGHHWLEPMSSMPIFKRLYSIIYKTLARIFSVQLKEC